MKKIIRMLLPLVFLVTGINVALTSLADEDVTTVASDVTSSSAHHVRHNKSMDTADASATVDINTASADVLTTVKGIGPKKAAAIVAYREQNGAFKSVDDLSKVKGLGAKSLQRIMSNNPGKLVVSANG